MKTYRACIIGCGPRGTAAARGYAAHPRTQVVGLCDLAAGRLKTLGEELGIAALYADLDDMLAALSPDIAVIPTGTEFHYPLCLRALDYGAHIDVEKPLCHDLEQADSILEKARQKGARLAVHHQGRVSGSMRALKRVLDEGRIGEVRYVTGSCKGYYGGYGLMNIGTHLVNALLGLVGHCRGVSATALCAGRPATPEDVVVAPGGMGTVVGEHITALLEFERGPTGTLLLHRFAKVDNAAYGLELFGAEGRLSWSSQGAWWLPVPHCVPDGRRDRWEPIPPEPPPVAPGAASPDEIAYVDEFVRALDEGREHECGGPEGHHVMEILMGILEASARGVRVALPQERRDHPLLRWRREAGLGPPLPGPRDYGAWLSAHDAARR